MLSCIAPNLPSKFWNCGATYPICKSLQQSTGYEGFKPKLITNVEILYFSYLDIVSASDLLIDATGSSLVLACCLSAVQGLSVFFVGVIPVLDCLAGSTAGVG